MKDKKIYILSDTDIKGSEKLPVIKQNFFDVDIDFKEYDYLIFTSKNGVKAAAKISDDWKKIPALAIGKATAEIIENLGGKSVYVAKKFYGDKFAKEILEKFDKNSRFLYLRGKVVLSKLSEILRKNGFKVDEKIVYETVCIDCKNLKRPEKGSFIIFSSPSTIECFLKCFTLDKSYKIVAIGEKTAKYIPKNIKYTVSPVQTLQGTVDWLSKIH